MKKLRITIDGQVYQVTVEVLEDDERAFPGAGLNIHGQQADYAAHRQGPPPRIAGGGGSRPEVSAPMPTAARPVDSDSGIIAAPIAGRVQKVFVAAGDTVQVGTKMILLDAMKMDSYIYSPRAGTIAEVCVAADGAVQIGEVLIRFATEPSRA